jgi:hypothetical protein
MKNMNQLNLFASRQAKEAGIKRAVDHADREIPSWSDKAYAFMVSYLSKLPAGTKFMVEDIRALSTEMGLEQPPSASAYGGIIQRLKHDGLIRHVGYTQVKYVKAHAANASLWQRV